MKSLQELRQQNAALKQLAAKARGNPQLNDLIQRTELERENEQLFKLIDGSVRQLDVDHHFKSGLLGALDEFRVSVMADPDFSC